MYSLGRGKQKRRAAERAQERRDFENMELIPQYLPEQRFNRLYSWRPPPRHVEPVNEDVGLAKELETKSVGEICKEIHLLELEKKKRKEGLAQEARAMKTGKPQERTFKEFLPKYVGVGGDDEPGDKSAVGAGEPSSGDQRPLGGSKSHSAAVRGRSRPQASRRPGSSRRRTPSPVVSSFSSFDSDSSDVYFSALSSLPSIDLDETETETETDDE